MYSSFSAAKDLQFNLLRLYNSGFMTTVVQIVKVHFLCVFPFDRTCPHLCNKARQIFSFFVDWPLPRPSYWNAVAEAPSGSSPGCRRHRSCCCCCCCLSVSSPALSSGPLFRDHLDPRQWCQGALLAGFLNVGRASSFAKSVRA